MPVCRERKRGQRSPSPKRRLQRGWCGPLYTGTTDRAFMHHMANVPSVSVQTVDLGKVADWPLLRFRHPRLGEVSGKTFLRDALGLTAMEVSVNSLAPCGVVPFAHAHRENEELYLFLGGHGEMLLDGEVTPVTEGSALRIAPDVMRAWRNTGDTPLVCVIVQAKEGSLTQCTAADGVVGATPPPWPEASPSSVTPQ